MDEPKLKNVSNFEREEKLLLDLLLIYCVGVFLCRLTGAYMRYVSYMDWTIYRKDLSARLPFYLMPFIALAWLYWSRFSRSALFFTAAMGLIGIIDHGYAAFISMRFGLPFFHPIRPTVRMNVLIALILAIAFAILALWIFRFSQRLYKLKNQESQNSNDFKTCAALVLLFFCHISPFIEYKEFARQVTSSRQDYKLIEIHKAGSRIRHLAGSPDGKLLAIGAEKGLYVWDAETQECVWSDDALRKVHRVRFSPSGKYLAAGGRGVPEGSSDIAVYEVEGFKRLPEIEMLEEDLTQEKIFHDIAFRPDEKSVLAAWHKDWDWEQVPGGYYGEDAFMRRNEEIITSNGIRKILKDLICTEWSLEEQGKSYSKTIKGLATVNDLMLSGGIGFSPSASLLLYPSIYGENNLVGRNRLYLVDTQTWLEEEIMLDRKYDMLTGGGTRRESYWYEWKFTKDEKDIYLLAEERDIDGMGRGMNTLAYLLLKLNLETKVTQEIFRVPKTAEMRSSVWFRIALSKDEEKIILLGHTDPFNNHSRPRGKYVVLRHIDLMTKETKQIAYLHDREINGRGRRIIWLSEETIAVVLREDADEFFFTNIREEND